MFTISQSQGKRNLILAVFLLSFSFISLGKEGFRLKNPAGNKIELRLALTKAEHTKGLSGLKAKDFKNTEGMLFVNPEMSVRRFWMPDTYFNLDIIFLDSDLKIVAIESNVPAHPGMQEPPVIYKTGTYTAQFVLETKAGVPFSKKLKANDVLKFTGPTSLSEIVSKTRQQQ